MKTWLIILGISSAVVLRFPTLVAFGYILLIPGLIMSLLPSTFIYLATFSLVRTALPVTPSISLNVLSIAITIGISLALSVPANLLGRIGFHATLESPVAPTEPIVLQGHIRLVRDGFRNLIRADGKMAADCDEVCKALLATPGVTAVTLAGSDFRGRPLSSLTWRHESPTKTGNPEKTYINEIELQDADFTINWIDEHDRGIGRISRQQLTIADREGGIRLRHQFIFGQPIAVPLLLLPTEIRAFELRWHWKRQKLTSGVRYELLQLLTKQSNLNRAY